MDIKRVKSIVFSCSINGLSIIRSLGRKGIQVVAVDYDKNALGFSSKYPSEFIIAPDPGVHEDEFFSFVLENSNKWAGSLLIPTQDIELAIFSCHKEELSRYYILPVPDWEATRKILDKKETYDIAARLDIPIPQTISLDSVESLENLQNDIGYPCLLKPRNSYEFNRKYGRKALIVEDFEQLKNGIGETCKAGCQMIIQEFISGKDDRLYSYMAYYDSESRPLAEFTRRKLRQNPPVLGVGRVSESTHTEEIITPSRRILSELSFIGLCGIEYKKDPKDEKFKLLDVNGRSLMHMGLPTRCGIDFPWIMYNDVVWNRKLNVSRYKSGIKWIHGMADIELAIRHPMREKLLTKDYLSPYFAPKTFAVFARDDWKPAFMEWYNRFRSLLRIILRNFMK